MELNASLVETLFLMRDGRTFQNLRKVCEQFNTFGIIDMNAQTGEQVVGRRCTLVLQEVYGEKLWGVDYAVGSTESGEPVVRAPWLSSIDGGVLLGGRNLMVPLTPLDKIVVTTYTPKRKAQ